MARSGIGCKLEHTRFTEGSGMRDGGQSRTELGFDISTSKNCMLFTETGCTGGWGGEEGVG